MSSITQMVSEQIAQSGENVKERVIQHLVDKECSRRTEAVIKALAMIDALEKDSKKIKPDIVSYNDDGSVATSAWSKAKLDERNANTSKIDKLQIAINKALDAGDFGMLFGLANSNAKADASSAD